MAAGQNQSCIFSDGNDESGPLQPDEHASEEDPRRQHF